MTGCWTLLIVLLAGGVLEKAAGQICDASALQGHVSELQRMSTDESLASVTSTEELDRVCGQMKELIRRVADYLENCVSPSYRDMVKRSLSGAGAVTQNLCDNDIFRERYLRHAACFQRVSGRFFRCGERYNTIVRTELSRPPPGQEELGRLMTSACCAYQEYESCARLEARATCGQEAADFMDDFLEKAVGPAMKGQCDDYDDHCGSPANVQTHPAPTLIIGLSVLMLTVSRLWQQ